jgi:hypothetical protein
VRTTWTNVTFTRPFFLLELERPQPAGTYRVMTDEEEISGLSFLAFRRVATMLRLPSLATSGRPEQMISIDADELSAALKADAGTK